MGEERDKTLKTADSNYESPSAKELAEMLERGAVNMVTLSHYLEDEKSRDRAAGASERLRGLADHYRREAE